MGIYYQNKGGFKTVHFSLLARPGLLHGFTTRVNPGKGKGDGDGCSNMGLGRGRDPQEGLTDRFLFARARNLSQYTFASARQVHGAEPAWVRAGDSFPLPAADAILTGEKGLVLTMVAADCALVYIIDKREQVIALVHAGWRGTAAGIIKNTISSLKSKTASLPENMLAAISPCIGPCCFQVGEDVCAAVGPGAEDLFVSAPKKGKWFLDLAGLIKRRLLAEGIPARNIETANLCTSCNEELFYSYRRDKGIAGRMIGYLLRE